MRFLGVDPGVSGGIACVDDLGELVEVARMPETEGDILALFVRLRSYGACRAALERVRAGPKMGSSAAFTFGSGYGGLRMAMLAAGIPWTDVMPRTWQQALGCHLAGLGKFGERDDTTAKNHTKAAAQQRFPRVKVTHAIADALLLAEYARRLERGMVTIGAKRGQTGVRARARREAVNTSLF